MKRYNCESNDNCGYMQEDPNGEYVKYEELQDPYMEASDKIKEERDKLLDTVNGMGDQGFKIARTDWELQKHTLNVQISALTRYIELRDEELEELRKEKQLWWQYLTKVVRDTSGWLKYKRGNNDGK